MIMLSKATHSILYIQYNKCIKDFVCAEINGACGVCLCLWHLGGACGVCLCPKISPRQFWTTTY